MSFEDPVLQERSKALRRMCILSAVMMVMSVTSLVIGAAAVQTSDGKFPFNAGGAIIAGILALLMSLCPMWMHYQAVQEAAQMDRGPDYIDKSCCCWAMFFWSFLILLGIPFGFVVNGAVAVNACVHPSEQNGCKKNADTKLVLAIATIIVTGLLMVLTIMILCTCCCSIRKDLKTPFPEHDRQLNTRRSRARNRNDVYNISSVDRLPRTSGEVASSSFGVLNFGPSYNSLVNGYIIEPTAPPEYWAAEGTRNEEEMDRAGQGSSHQQHGPSSEYPGYTSRYSRYDDPPPTYYEVMEKDPMETPL